MEQLPQPPHSEEQSLSKEQLEIQFLLKQHRAFIRWLLTGRLEFDASLQEEHWIQDFKRLLCQLNLEERFFTIFNDCYLPVNHLLENSTKKIDEPSYNIFLISILGYVTLRHLNIQGLSDFEEAIATKLKEISSDDFDLILMIVHARYRLHNYVSLLDS
jgi:hypothetical protein